MKIKFNSELGYQQHATSAIVDVFQGQEVCQTNFTVAPLKAETAEMAALFEAAGHGHVDPLLPLKYD